LKYAKLVVENVQPQMAQEFPSVELFLPTVTYAHLRFGKWDDVLATPAPDQKLHFTTAIMHYARARAFAAKGDVARAQAEHALIASSFNADDAKRFEAFGVPGGPLVSIAGHVAAADIARAKGQVRDAIRELRAAVKLQDGLAYMEPPYWDFPVRQFLGAALLQANEVKSAEITYREDLMDWQNNGWSLFGLREALKAQRKTRAAHAADVQFQKAWARADVKLTQSRF
jgi:tetratricopeptide (TPR) repeat protein